MRKHLALLFLVFAAALPAAAQQIALLDKVPGHRVTFDYTYG